MNIPDFLFKLYAERIVRDAYVGVLEREPDKIEIAEYSHAMKKGLGLAGLIADLAQSKEAIDTNFAKQSETMIAIAAQQLIGRHTLPTEIQCEVSPLRRAADLATLLSKVAKSRQHVNKILADNAGQLIHAILQATLARAPDAAELKQYARHLSDIESMQCMIADVVRSDEHWQKSVATHAIRIIQSAFISILGRQPDAGALATYSNALQSGVGITGLVSDLANSEEALERNFVKQSGKIIAIAAQELIGRQALPGEIQGEFSSLRGTEDLAHFLRTLATSSEHVNKVLADNAEQFIGAILQATLDRVPDADDLARYTQQLSGIESVRGIIAGIMQSEEHWHKCVATHASHIVQSVFLSLLGRQPDAGALATYSAMLKENRDLTQFMRAVAQSSEHKRRHAPEHQSRPLGDHVEHINKLYIRYRGQPVSNIELSAHITTGAPGWKIHRQLLSEFKSPSTARRILIFGAYGNGNLGDMYQALAVREHVKAAWGVHDEDVFACSLLALSSYPFPESQKLPPQAIYDYDLLNGFDCLVIGGGGLLAHPHEPLFSEVWVNNVEAPIIIFAVGATSDQIARHQPLLQRAVYVSARDDAAMSALRPVREDVVYAPDPILATSNIAGLTTFDKPAAGVERHPCVLWILKYPANEDDRELLRLIQSIIKTDATQKHVIAGIEPLLDSVLNEYFDDRDIVLTNNLLDLSCHFEEAKLVFSMRYHGAIFGLLFGRNVFGASQSKIFEMFKQLGRGDAYIRYPNDIRTIFDREGVTAHHDALSDLRKTIDNALSIADHFQFNKPQKLHDTNENKLNSDLCAIK